MSDRIVKRSNISDAQLPSIKSLIATQAKIQKIQTIRETAWIYHLNFQT